MSISSKKTLPCSENRPKLDQFWIVFGGTRTIFLCAIGYVVIVFLIVTVYFLQYPVVQVHLRMSETKENTMVPGHKTVTMIPTTHSKARHDKETSYTTTEASLTSPALQPIEPKNWARNGYESIPDNKLLNKHCATCAVVTSSGHLKQSKQGVNIDNADCVIRMNAAPSLKYERDVGSRTTFRVIGHRNFPSVFKTEKQEKYHITNTTTKSDYIIVSWLYAVNLKRNTPYKLCKNLAKKYPGFSCYLGTEDTMGRYLDVFYNELGILRNNITLWLSTGWTTMLFALEVCDKIDAYGMVYDGYCDEHPKQKIPYHYYDKVRTECSYYSRSERKTSGGHKFLTEKAIFGKLASIYNITFHMPSWEGHLAERNASSSIDSPYKRIYHYLQWKKEHERNNNVSTKTLPQGVKNVDTHTKVTAKIKANHTAVKSKHTN